MGGAKYTGNMSPVAEYNFWADPLAAKEVLNAGFQDAVMIGLDVTNKIALGADVRELLRIFNTKLSNFLYNVTRVGLDDNWNSRRKPVAPMHDVLTVAYFIDPTILTLKRPILMCLPMELEEVNLLWILTGIGMTEGVMRGMRQR